MRLEDLRLNRIHLTLDSLTDFTLAPQPVTIKNDAGVESTATVTPDEFLQSVRAACRRAAAEIQQRNLLLEKVP